MANKQADKKKKKKRSKISSILLTIGFVIATCVLVYPTFMDSLLDIKQSVMLGGYAESLEQMSPEKVMKMKQEAKDYNEKIYKEQQHTPFYYKGEDYDDEEYDNILKISDINAIMGYIEIPSINLYLPITHGTHAEDLNFLAGHMHGTTVPIGGEHTHAVVAAHTGLATADLFTNVYKLKEGDEVCIHVLDEIRVYLVQEVNILKPLEVTPYMQIEGEEDLITLFTCTPYGVNDHRRLIKCKYAYDKESDGSAGTTADVHNLNKAAILHTIMWGMIPVIVLIIGLYSTFHKKKKKGEKK